MKKKLPKFKTDEEDEAFVDEADLSEYDLSDMKPVSFEFQPKDKSITMRLPETLFDAIKKEAERFQGYPINGLSVRPLKTPCILGSKWLSRLGRGLMARTAHHKRLGLGC